MKSTFVNKGSSKPYTIYQFAFNEIFLLFKKRGFSSEIIRDNYTDSKPQFIDDGLIRTFYIIKGEKF